MSITQEEFGHRLAGKPIVTEADLRRYQQLDDRQFSVRVGEQSVPMLPRDVDGPLSPVEEMLADMEAPFWSNNGPSCSSVPATVDLSREQTDVKNQRGRSTCVAFASMAAIEHIVKVSSSSGVDLSEQYANWMFMKYEGSNQCRGWLQAIQAAKYLSRSGVCEDRFWNYTGAEGLRCMSSPPPGAAERAVYGIKKYVAIGRGLAGPRIGNTNYVECILAQGKSIVVAVDIAIGDDNPDDGVYDVLRDGSLNTLTSQGGHAMLLVGYNKNKEYFIFKNSWGPDADHDGYMWLSYDYVRRYSKYGFIVMDVDYGMKVPVGLASLNVGDLNMRLGLVDMNYYFSVPGASLTISLPVLARTESTQNLAFMLRNVGEVFDWSGAESVSTDEFLLPGNLEIRASKRGIGHLVLSAYDQKSGLYIPGVKSLLITIDVRAT